MKKLDKKYQEQNQRIISLKRKGKGK